MEAPTNREISRTRRCSFMLGAIFGGASGSLAGWLVSRNFGLTRKASLPPQTPLADTSNLDHPRFMRLAIEQAEKVPRIPFGAVIVDRVTGRVVAEGPHHRKRLGGSDVVPGRQLGRRRAVEQVAEDAVGTEANEAAAHGHALQPPTTRTSDLPSYSGHPPAVTINVGLPSPGWPVPSSPGAPARREFFIPPHP